jgi:7,8-dihydroneopterin aldolase/epimerase/oxygenase
MLDTWVSIIEYEIFRSKFPKKFRKLKKIARNAGPHPRGTPASAQAEIHIEQLKLLARIGVSAAERKKRQRLVLNITVIPARDLRDMKDSVAHTVDYSLLCREVKNFVAAQVPKLLETLASELASHLLCTFQARKITVEIRKFVLPDAAYASVKVTHTAALD